MTEKVVKNGTLSSLLRRFCFQLFKEWCFKHLYMPVIYLTWQGGRLWYLTPDLYGWLKVSWKTGRNQIWIEDSSTLAKGLSERVQSRGEFMCEISLLNGGEFKGFFDREMHALLLLSLRSLPPEFKMSLPLLFHYFPHWDWSSSFTYCSIRSGTYWDSTFSSYLVGLFARSVPLLVV